MWSARTHSFFLYSDARTHLDIARHVTDGLTPGLAQLGSVWLPLPHLLLVPLVASAWMWHSGAAGAIVGGACFVYSAVRVYTLVDELTGNRVGAWCAFAIYATNLNLLYLQTAALTEPVLLAFFIGAIYHLARWMRTRSVRSLALAGLLTFGASLSRYEGWVLLFAAAGLVLCLEPARASPGQGAASQCAALSGTRRLWDRAVDHLQRRHLPQPSVFHRKLQQCAVTAAHAGQCRAASHQGPSTDQLLDLWLDRDRCGGAHRCRNRLAVRCSALSAEVSRAAPDSCRSLSARESDRVQRGGPLVGAERAPGTAGGAVWNVQRPLRDHGPANLCRCYWSRRRPVAQRLSQPFSEWQFSPSYLRSTRLRSPFRTAAADSRARHMDTRKLLLPISTLSTAAERSWRTILLPLRSCSPPGWT